MAKLNLKSSILNLENQFLKLYSTGIKIGDSIKVGVKIIEGNKERVQFYEGTIIAKKNSSLNSTVTVRKIVQGIGIERIFLLHSPKLYSINIFQSYKVRKSKLYYLRNLSGKASRLRQSF